MGEGGWWEGEAESHEIVQLAPFFAHQSYTTSWINEQPGAIQHADELKHFMIRNRSVRIRPGSRTEQGGEMGQKKQRKANSISSQYRRTGQKCVLRAKIPNTPRQQKNRRRGGNGPQETKESK